MKFGDEVLVLSVEGHVRKVAIAEDDRIELKTSFCLWRDMSTRWPSRKMIESS
jgi:hypothetical protein